ncbi:MAG TPA: CsbD family protein, partial [Pirellulales bacterium]|nr:CsbD family protein [Pirellulales bacterium]
MIAGSLGDVQGVCSLAQDSSRGWYAFCFLSNFHRCGNSFPQTRSRKESEIIMVSQQTLKGDWNEVAGKLRSKWGQLNNDEMQEFKGNATQLVGYIQRKTGEAKNTIERFLNDLTEVGADSVSRVAGATKGFASQAVQSA